MQVSGLIGLVRGLVVVMFVIFVADRSRGRVSSQVTGCAYREP